jgi:hypothetical protein
MGRRQGRAVNDYVLPQVEEAKTILVTVKLERFFDCFFGLD